MNDQKKLRLKRQHNILKAKVEENLEQYISSISSIIIKSINQYPTNWIESKKEIIDILYNSFTDTITITQNEVNNIYFHTKKSINITQALNNIYSKDGKTLEDRIDYWWVTAQDKINIKLEDNTKIAIFLTNKILRILKNENYRISNGVINNKVSPFASFIIIEGVGACNGDGPCAEYIGEHPIDEISDLPPYHVNCQCECYYDVTDDPDEIEELDLEDETNLNK